VKYDVVVVGGRIAGASTALLLARAGARVALVERSRLGSDTLSTHGIMRAGILQLSRWGLLDRVVAAGTPPVVRSVFHYPDGALLQVSIRPSPGVNALYAPRRTVLDRILVDAAEEAGAHVLPETTVTSLVQHETGRVQGVVAQDATGTRTQIEAAMTVGADGLRSVVAQQVGAPVQRQGRTASAVLYRYVDDLPAAGYEWVYGDRASAGLIPTNAGATCVFVGTTPARMRQLRRAGRERAFTALLASASPALHDRVLGAGASTPMSGWGGVPGHVRQSWGPGWALVGDAGYFKDPITAHGITDGLRDAELLADQVLQTLGGVPEDEALPAYQTTRDRLSSQMFEATEEVAGFEWDAARARVLLRAVSAAMSDEVDHLQALPERNVGPGIGGFLPTDKAAQAG
jgi:2-polyprenyl-6-methoxyphenol hydroxylase-like FAD-dependent oxidoreductase